MCQFNLFHNPNSYYIMDSIFVFPLRETYPHETCMFLEDKNVSGHYIQTIKTTFEVYDMDGWCTEMQLNSFSLRISIMDTKITTDVWFFPKSFCNEKYNFKFVLISGRKSM